MHTEGAKTVFITASSLSGEEGTKRNQKDGRAGSDGGLSSRPANDHDSRVSRGEMKQHDTCARTNVNNSGSFPMARSTGQG